LNNFKSHGVAKTQKDILRYILKEKKIDKNKIHDFINSNIYHNPFKFTNMQDIVDTIKYYIDNNKKIRILGD